MPKVKITEVDNTSAVQLGSISNVVYIPGLSASGNLSPKLYESVKSLEDDSEHSTSETGSHLLVEDGSYKLAHRLLQLGMQVLYEGRTGGDGQETDTKTYKTTLQTGVEESGGEEYKFFKVAGIGSDIEFIVDAENNTITYSYEGTHSVSGANGHYDFSDIDTIIVSADIAGDSVSYAKEVVVSATSITEPTWKNLEDKNIYNIRFLTSGAYALQSGAMLSTAVHRGDCTALVDHAKSVTSVTDVRTAIQAVITSSSESDKAGAFSSAFSPWIKVRLDDTSDAVELPGSAGYLLAYARMVQTNPSWYAAAGSFRGVIPGLNSVLVEYSKADCEQLQARAATGEVELDSPADNVGIAINPICNIRPFGYIVFGNRTLVDNDGSTKATSFLNVRNLVSTIKKELYFASNKYTFEQNNEVLWINFKSQITPLLDRMQSGNGIEGYKLIKQATDKKARLKAKIVIIPIEAVEDFELEVSLEDSLEVVEG